MYGMSQATIASSSTSTGSPSILPMVRKVRASVATPIRGGAPSSEGAATTTKASGSLHSFKGQKWNTFVENADTPRDADRRGNDPDGLSGSVMRLDCKEMSIYGVCPETDRFMAVVCQYCGSIVKPQSLKEHIKRHAKDPSAVSTFQELWKESKSWLNEPPEDTKLKPPMAVSSTKGTSDKCHPDGINIRDPGSLYIFKGQKWNALLNNTEHIKIGQNEDRLEAGCIITRLDGAEVDRLTSVVCHFCGSVVKPHALQAHMNRHATDSAVSWSETKAILEVKGSTADVSESAEGQIKPPMTATACMSSGIMGLQQGTSPSKGTTAPLHPDNIEALDTLLQSDLGSTMKGIKKTIAPRGKGRQAGKEREYDPDRHCGVSIDSGKPCTRTLTCKSHTLSLRRQVPGRSVPFDKLLLDHRNSRAARLRMSVSGVLPDADSSNSSSSFDIERKSLSTASSSNSSGCPTVGSPPRHTEDLEGDHKVPIKLTDCSVTLNKLKREHTTPILAGTTVKRQHLEKPPETTDVSDILDRQIMCSPILDTKLLTTADQQLTVAVPLSMISVMNLSGSMADGSVQVSQVTPVHPESGLFTLSNRARRDHYRSKLHLLRRTGTKVEENPLDGAPEPAEEFPDVDTWHSSIPRPCQVNSMKLRRIGGGCILSRRFCNFRKALLANMSTNMVSTSGQSILSSSTNVGTVASLLGRGSVGSTSKHTVYLDKVNFSGERIKV